MNPVADVTCSLVGIPSSGRSMGQCSNCKIIRRYTLDRCYRRPEGTVCSVRSTLSEMRSMSFLGGSGGMPPHEILKKYCSEIEFRSNFD